MKHDNRHTAHLKRHFVTTALLIRQVILPMKYHIRTLTETNVLDIYS